MTVMTSRQGHVTTRSGRRKGALISYDGKSMTMTQWAEHLGISYNALYWRMRGGAPLQLALSHEPLVRRTARERKAAPPPDKKVLDVLRAWLLSPAPVIEVLEE